MEMTTQDYLKKALLDTQERVRDFMNYSQQLEDEQLQSYFKEYAKSEGLQAEKLQSLIKDFS